MRAWIIETSTERGVIAFVENNKVLFVKYLPFGHNQSKLLMPEIHAAYQKLGYSPAEIDCIGIGIGPGSYTSIRVGAAIAKALAYVWHIPLISFCSLEGFVPQKDGVFAAIIDAKIGGAYFIKGIANQGHVSYISQPMVSPLEELDSQLEKVDVLVTPQCSSLKTKLEILYPHHTWRWEETNPCISHLGSIVYSKYQQKQWNENTQLELLYLRKTEAERNKEK